MRRADAEKLYYGLEFFLAMPTWVVTSLYLVSVLHLSPLQLVLMGTAMEATVFLFEIPTGVVADTYSRRLSLIVGYLGTGLAWLLVGVVSAPWAVIALWALWGFFYTFTSGAEQAWITDEVGMENVGTVFLRGARFGQAGAVVGLLLQVAVGVVSLRAGVILGGAFTIVCGLAAILLMPETGFRRRPRAERGSALAELRTTALAGVRYAWAAPVIVLLIGAELFMGASSEALIWSKAYCKPARRMFALSAPASPRSVVSSTMPARCTGRRSSSGCRAVVSSPTGASSGSRRRAARMGISLRRHAY